MPDSTIPTQVRALAARLSDAKPMRRGSLTKRYVKCNRGGCACGDHDDARHGPYFSVSRVVKGRTQSRWLSVEQARLVGAQVQAGQEFRKQVEAYWNVCEEWADTMLGDSTVASDEAAKKGGSKKSLTAKSSPK